MANEFVHASAGTTLTQSEFEAIGLHVLDSQATGDLIYASSATQLSRLAIGSGVLVVSGGIPAWSSTLPAVTLGDTLTLNGQIFNAGSGWAQVDTTGSYAGFRVWNTNEGAGGASLQLRHISTTPAVSDMLGRVRYSGKNTNTPQDSIDYGSIGCFLVNATPSSEEAKYQWDLYTGGASNLAMTLSGAGGLWTDLSVDTLTYKVSGTQVVGARVVDARCDDAVNSGDATTDGVIDALRDCLITHGLIAAS